MKKYFIVSDVHSHYNEMMEALKKSKFNKKNPDHIFVSLGDLLDRGNFTLETLLWVNSLPDDRKILIRGNHEDLLEELFQRKEVWNHDIHNGTVRTVIDLARVNFSEEEKTNKVWLSDAEVIQRASQNKDIIKYLSSLVDYALIGDCICVHGWIPCICNGKDKYEYQKDWQNGDWSSARWINGALAWSQGVRPEGKTVVCGHYHTSWAHSHLHNEGSEFDEDAVFTPFKDEGIVALDSCVAYSYFCNCFVIEEK